MRNPLVTDYLDGFRDVKLVGINDTTASTIRDVVLRANEEGQGIDEIRRRIGGVFDDAKGYRAERIARTEAVGSANAANVAAWQISGLVDEKEWLAVPDDQTRETHADMDGQRVGLNDTFTSPSGATTQHTSDTVRAGSLCLRANSQTPTPAPASPPWNDMPPCQTARICPGWSRKKSRL